MPLSRQIRVLTVTAFNGFGNKGGVDAAEEALVVLAGEFVLQDAKYAPALFAEGAGDYVLGNDGNAAPGASFLTSETASAYVSRSEMCSSNPS